MEYIKRALRVLGMYGLTVFGFLFFFPAIFVISKDNLKGWTIGYSFLFFSMLFTLIYNYMKTLGFKDRASYRKSRSYPLKGLVIGLLGFLPVMLIEVFLMYFDFGNESANIIKIWVLNLIAGPVYGFSQIAGGSMPGYAFALSIVPLLSMVAYMRGYFDIKPSEKADNSKNIRGAGKK